MFLFLVILNVFNICIVGINSLEPKFNYNIYDEVNGPLGWSNNCKVPKQSPINIIEADAQQLPYRNTLFIEKYSITPKILTAKKDEYTVELNFKYPNNQQSRLYGGPLGDAVFLFEKIHFHWGESSAGSEHAINSKAYAAEIHMVHYNSIYGSFEKAVSQADGLTVIAVLIEIGTNSANTTKPFMKYLQKVLRGGTEYVETENLFTIQDVIQSKYFNYFSYHGSLTTPPCSESVTWIVAKNPLTITPAELAQFNQLRNEKGASMTNNWRPLQATNNRIVYSY
ncbi:unnamed protein product [Diamesa serratosioi]